EEFKKHVGGMYGYVIEDMFDETKEFSLEEGLSQLEGLNEKEILEYKEEKFDMERFLLNLHQNITWEEKPDNNPFIPGMWYKCVGEDWTSKYHNYHKIEYKVGKIVNGGSKGIFVHRNPEKPWDDSGYWVELKPLDGVNVLKEDSNKACLTGDLLVTKRFLYRHKDPNNLVVNMLSALYQPEADNATAEEDTPY